MRKKQAWAAQEQGGSVAGEEGRGEVRGSMGVPWWRLHTTVGCVGFILASYGKASGRFEQFALTCCVDN